MRLPVSDERGFSLTELVISVSLLAVVIAAAYAGLNAIQAASEVSDRQALFATEVGSPLLAIEEILQQTLRVESASAYSITVTCDVDNDDFVERHTITAEADGRLTHLAWNTDKFLVNTTMRYNQTWSTNNVNRAEAVPLFYYYREDGTQITDYAEVQGDVKSMDVRVIVEEDGRQYSSQRTAVLRNL